MILNANIHIRPDTIISFECDKHKDEPLIRFTDPSNLITYVTLFFNEDSFDRFCQEFSRFHTPESTLDRLAKMMNLLPGSQFVKMQILSSSFPGIFVVNEQGEIVAEPQESEAEEPAHDA